MPDDGLRNVLEKVEGKGVLVAGEVLVRRCLEGQPRLIAGDAPALRLDVLREYEVPDGAAAAGRMLKEAGAQVAVAGVVGDDETGQALLDRLASEGIDVTAVVCDAEAETAVLTEFWVVAEGNRRYRLWTGLRRQQQASDEGIVAQLLAWAGRAAREADVIAVLEGGGAGTDVLTAELQAVAAETGAEMVLVSAEGMAQLTPENMATGGKLRSLKELLWLVRQVRDRGGKVAFTNGCFDLLHAGHVNYLRAAGEQGDFFVVALNSDESVRRIKGPGRPVVNERERAAVLSALECIDAIVVFTSEDVRPLLEAIRPEVYVKGGDYSIDTINQAERRLVESYGGQIALLPGEEGASTTSILRRIREEDEG